MYSLYPLILCLLIVPQTVFADCALDRFGDVYCGMGKCVQDKAGAIFCSKYQFGDAVVDKYGNAVCGKGQCLSSTEFNDYFCSTAEGGGAQLDSSGLVKCYKACEKASIEMCESEKGK